MRSNPIGRFNIRSTFGAGFFNPINTLARFAASSVIQMQKKEKTNHQNVQFHVMCALQQMTPLWVGLSDHKAGISKQGDQSVLIYNMMMKCKSHNNGFSAVEADADYQRRIAHVTLTLVQILVSNPHITIMALQEAPIRPEDIAIMADIFGKFLPDWERAQFDMTDFGLMTFIKSESCQSGFYMDRDLSQALHEVKLDERCLTFVNENNYKFSNIHVPHGMNGKAQASLRLILEKVIEDAIQTGVLKHDIAGDFNSNAEQVEAVLKEVWFEKCKALKKVNLSVPALKLSAQFDPSVNGHRKADGTEIDADGVLSLQFSNADGKTDQFNFQTKKLGYLAAIIFGLTMVPEGVFDETILAGVTSVLSL